MGVNRVTDRRGKTRVEVRRRWSDGSEFRRYYPNMTAANETYHEIEVAIAKGTWPELRDRLSGNKQEEDDLSPREFSEIYLEKYCKVYNKRPDFKVQALSHSVLSTEFWEMSDWKSSKRIMQIASLQSDSMKMRSN